MRPVYDYNLKPSKSYYRQYGTNSSSSYFSVNNRIKVKISEVSKKIDNINAAIAERVWSDSTVATLKALEAEQNSLYSELAGAEKIRVVIDNSLDDIMGVLDYLSAADFDTPKNKQALLTFTERINVFDEYADIIVNPLKKEVSTNIKVPVGTSMSGAADRTALRF